MEPVLISIKKRHLDGIRSSRPSNIIRVFFSIVFIFVSHWFAIPYSLTISFVHFGFSVSWLILIERFFPLYDANPRLWYVLATADVLWVLFWVFLTGMTFSPAVLGFILITTLSSMDLNKNRGFFVAAIGSFFFLFLGIGVQQGILSTVNITVSGQPTQVTMFSVGLSSLLLLGANFGTHTTLYTIHLQLHNRNQELRSAFSEISQLKIQQDGDYYLTSLLIEPLAFVLTEGEQFSIESKVKQYKTFAFKSEKAELGGDLNLTSSVTLDQKYLFFTNSDAMGKSIQGAGGVLVLSSVLKSILERTRSKQYGNQTGKQWLETIFRELNSVFESFEGSMYVTGLFGVIGEKDGSLYTIRAEHPYPILFKANSELTSYWELPSSSKLGTPHSFLNVNISSKTLEPGDYLFMGSDGKDDLLDSIGDGKEEFLQLVEKKKGDWDSIWQVLIESGQASDDLSLLKIFRKK